MVGGVTQRMLPHLSGVPHLHVNRPLGGLVGNHVTMIKKNKNGLSFACWGARVANNAMVKELASLPWGLGSNLGVQQPREVLVSLPLFHRSYSTNSVKPKPGAYTACGQNDRNNFI